MSTSQETPEPGKGSPDKGAAGKSAVPVGLLRQIVDARREELGPLFASMLWIFLALTAYYIIKPLRSAVLQENIGVDHKSIALLATTIFVGFFAYAYGKIVPVVARSRLIVFTFGGMIACLLAFAVALPRGGPLTGYTFYVWVSTFNLLIVSQFWSLATDVWTKEEGVRLFGFIGVGGVAGGIFGTLVVSGFARTLSTQQMLLLSAAVLGLCLLLALYILRFGAKRGLDAAKDQSAPESTKPQASNSITLVLGSRYLQLIAAMMFVLNIVNTNNEWILDKMVSHEHMASDVLKAFYAKYFLVQNVVTFAIQFFLTTRVQKRFGARGALFFEPVIGILGGLSFIAMPILAVIRGHKILENATDYSIQTNTKELLYLPLSKVEKYSAKNFNDTFVVRGGDAVAAGLIFLATERILPALGDRGLRVMIAVDVVLGLLWLLIANSIGRMHSERMQALDVAKDDEKGAVSPL